MEPVEGPSTGSRKQDNFDDLAPGPADRSPARGTFVLNKDISTQVGRRHRLPVHSARREELSRRCATTIDGVISTRRGNGASWSGMIGKPPAGEWELSFNFDDPVKDQEIRNRFKNEEIWDILFVITYGGRTPAWPA